MSTDPLSEHCSDSQAAVGDFNSRALRSNPHYDKIVKDHELLPGDVKRHHRRWTDGSSELMDSD
jgi:hypothetical protein